ncbi:ATP-binding cassette domain-containing protein [Chloroflexales bacterium ZM16-3]|nr:ATP-binding cassette domain-containing protein [Chloroflexales bacterium ZM16-3]
MEPILQCIGLTKRFGTLGALDRVSFSVGPGEVVGLVGRSGAGKSVLADLLAGLMVPSDGEALIDGHRLRWPFQAPRHGVAVVPQRPALADRLDITSNIFLGAELGWPRRLGWLRFPDRRRMDHAALEVLATLELSVESLRAKANQLSSEQRQLIAIARAMVIPARLVILDEPTALLSYSSQQRLLGLIRSWQQQGIAVIFASSSLDHIFAVTDRVIVLNEGHKALDARTDSTSREQIVAALIGQGERQQLTPIIWALESYYSARDQSEHLRLQQRRLERDLAVQDSLNQQLIKQLAEQVKSLDQANLALQDAQRRLLTEREGERKYLARELHDQVIQDLLSVNFQLEDLQSEADEESGLSQELAEVRLSMRALVDDVRQICGNLRPPTIDSLGLGAALQSYTRDWAARTGVSVDLQIGESLGRLSEELELSIFRIVQESLSNVRKHAHARQVEVRLVSTSPRALGITIADDGAGLRSGLDLAALANAGHYGLLGISERVALLQGKLRIYNRPSGGLVIEAEIPHPRLPGTGAA